MSIVTQLLKSDSLAFFLKSLGKEPSLLIEGLWEAPKAALIALIQKELKKNILFITKEQQETKLLDNLDYFDVAGYFDFPSWETLPGEEIPPSPDIVGKRLEILYQLSQSKTTQVVCCSLQACLQKVVSSDLLIKQCRFLRVQEETSFEALPSWLQELGYRRVAVAADKGEFALRGGIIDIFPLSSSDPYRIEFFGDRIESIRTYDPMGQKSISKVDSLFICPASELSLLKTASSLSSIVDYLGESLIIVFDDLLALEDRYVALKSLGAHQQRFFMSFEELLERSKDHFRLFLSQQPLEDLSDIQMGKKAGRDFYTGKNPLQPLTFEMFHLPFKTKRWNHPFEELASFFEAEEAQQPFLDLLKGIDARAASSIELHFITATESEEKTLKTFIREQEIHLPEATNFERGYLTSGFVLKDLQIALVPMAELTQRYRIRRQKWRSNYHTPAAEFHELKPGDMVVHFHSGIGKYLGVEKRPNHQGILSEFLVLEYAENSKLYVPMSSAHLVSRYIGAHEEAPHLSQLGTQRWQHQRVKAEKAIVGYAHDLLKINAERELFGGFVFPEDSPEMHSFEFDFPFIETDDQLKALEDVKKDMMSKKAMDRLVCGDVGYGKTEVAMRAAFKAVVDGKKQVAVLVPTTVLAMQHFDTFKERMANYPINIAVASRFLPPKKVKENLEKVALGQIDILIGTHRLISQDVHFRDLGLIIIDEEQRFGVRAKEHLKKMKAGVDCLTLSATPIPRTLYLSLIGAKEISLINTPPQDRLPIKTHISERDSQIMQNALLRELSRDGQAFFVHNRVETIFEISEELKKLMPQARIVTAHGQMSSDELDTIFHLFKRGDADILVATTIIENGIDIPNANTILIDRADQFGLADLYQMRGRVGRWNRPAYAYFLIPKKARLSEVAQKRLQALAESTGYGGGMKVAMRDLEIRGAGDILGTQQSGQISTIGFHLYCKLLKKTIDAIKSKKQPQFIEAKIEFPFDAKLPEEYINESSLRMEIYHRLGEASSFSEVDALLEELKDRFGTPPEPVIWLLAMTKIRIHASQKGYLLLKFERFTIQAEKAKGKQIQKLVLTLPKFKTANELIDKMVLLL